MGGATIVEDDGLNNSNKQEEEEQEKEKEEGIDVISLRSIDLRHFGGDELRLVAQFSGHFPEASFGNLLVPKIDRSCFNESAGSRKQTYSNRSSNGSSSIIGGKHSSRSVGLVTSTSGDYGDGGADERMRNAAGVGSARPSKSVVVARKVTTGESVGRQGAWKRLSTSDLVWRCGSEREGERTRDLLRTGSEDAKIRRATSFETTKEGRWARAGARGVADAERFAANVSIQGNGGRIAGIVAEPISRKKFRTSIDAFKNGDESEEAAMARRSRKRSGDTLGGLGEGGLVRVKRSRGRLLDSVGGLFESKHLELEPRPGRARKRTTGERDMMERLAKMKGKWSSGSRTWKIVDASGFPVGWTVGVGLKYKDGRVLFEYRDWRSPDGTLWSSFKDASAFLLSSIGQHPTSSEMVVLLKHGPEMIRGEGISAAMKESTNETVCACSENLTSISSVAAPMDPPRNFCSPRLGEAVDETGVGSDHGHGRFSSEPVSRVQLDESCPTVGNAPNLGGAVGVASHAETLGSEGCHSQISNKVETLDSGQSSCYMCSRTAQKTFLGRPSCSDHTMNTPDPSNDADLKGPSNYPHPCSTSRQIENSENSGCKIEGAQNCTRLTPSNASPHKCSCCGTRSSTLLTLRGHLRRANKGRQVKCDVYGRQCSSFASLLSHRVKMGHPLVTRVSRRQQPKVSEPVSTQGGSKMLNIVLGLLSDTDGSLDSNGNHSSGPEKLSSKATKDLRSTDMLKVACDEVKQDKEQDVGLSSTFECEICHKVFNRRSQYWGHLSSHSKQRKKALQSCAPLESVSKRSSSRVADVESNLAMVVREDLECEAGAQYAVESVFWKLLDDSSRLEEHKHELDTELLHVPKSLPALRTQIHSGCCYTRDVLSTCVSIVMFVVETQDYKPNSNFWTDGKQVTQLAGRHQDYKKRPSQELRHTKKSPCPAHITDWR